MKGKMKKIGIAGTLLVLLLLLGLAGWLIFGNKSATQKVVDAKNMLGIDWYDENQKEFTITTAEELFEIQKLSGYYDFAGQTIKLGADIVVNEGSAEDWINAVTYPEKAWESIYGFAGTFDGQGHTISGIYCIGYLYTTNLYRSEQTDYVTAGLFRSTSKDCVIKNFRLVNSFFDGDLNKGSSCISSNGGGTFENIYVDAVLTSQKNNVGGIMGLATDDVTIRNCWFDGEINIIGGYARPTGGIVGLAPAGKKCVIEHCLMSGVMNNDLYQRGVNMGGILGTSQGSTVEITDCLVSGTLNNEWQIVGSAIGNVPAESTATLTDVYTVKEAWKITIGHTTGELNGTPVTFEREKLLGYGGYQWTSLDFDNYWAAVDGDTPVLKTFAENPLDLDGVTRMVDLTWYDDAKDTFEIHDLADFYGFALLSYSHNFEGKTVKLCTDITINSGNAADWAKNAPEYDWISIGSSNLPFKGTFDGQMHTISGVYLKTDKSYNGLFGMTKDEAVVKNFSLKNSYFESSAASFGSIAGRGVGTFDTIYSDAIVRSSNGNIGGMIGQVTGGDKLVMKNCWFDGSVKSTENDLLCRKIGGLLGFVITKVEISNCLNSGTIDASIYDLPNSETSKSVQPYVGGFIGQIHPSGEARISDSMNVGAVLYNAKANSSFGSIVGTASGDGTHSTVIFSGVYATKESCARTATGYMTGQVLAFDEATLKGFGGYQWTTLNFNKYWSVVENSTSILTSFAKKSPSISGVARMIDISWYNEKDTSYILNDVADLYGFIILSYTNNFAGKTVKLGADITVNTGNAADWAKNAPTIKWMSISSRTLPFAGTFDGQMHALSGLYLKTDAENSGMFSTTAQTAVIKNFRLENSYFESSAISLGSISGRGTGTFDTIYTDAILVTSNSNVAGIVAQATEGEKVTVRNCWFDGSIKCTGDKVTARRAGGLLGFVVSDADITNSLSTGTIDATETTYFRPYIGGFCGQIYKTSTVNIAECMSAGSVLQSKEATSSYGSVIGYAEKTATIAHTYAIAESNPKTVSGSTSGQVIVYDRDRITGYGGYQWTTLNFDKYWSVVLDDTSILKSFAKSVPSLEGVEAMLDISWYNEKDTKFTLNTEAEFFGFALLSTMNNFKGKTIALGDNMNIANEGTAGEWAANAPKYEWLSIGTTEYPFAGTFDGKGYEISGIYQSTDKENGGLFGVTADTAVIKNFSLTNSYFESTAANLGSIAGRGIGTFSKIYSDAIVASSNGSVGGFIGRTTAGSSLDMDNCWFAGSVTNSGNSTTARFTGGLIGRVFNDVTLTNCLNTGLVAAENYTVTESDTDTTVRPYIGGLVGFMGNKMTLTITSCVNAGELRISSEANTGYGSLVGRIDSATTANATNTYTITDYCSEPTSRHPSATTNLLTDVQKETLVEIMGTKAFAKMPGLFLTEKEDGTYQSNWAAVANSAPVPACFAEGDALEVDISWYDKSGTYELSDRADIYGFALLSVKTSFKDETIKLTADIVVNEGHAKDWSESVAPDYPWISISQNSALSFQGVFDGQGYKISGIYLNEATAARGLFAYVDNGAVIRNLSLTETYIYSTQDNVGSIAGRVNGGTFERIYSDAIIEAKGHNVGGLVGRVQGTSDVKASFAMNNCWFAGSVSNLTSDKQNFGGLVGRTFNATYVSAIKITNCLNSGTIAAEIRDTPFMGGIYGYNDYPAMVVSNCLNVGTITCKPGATDYGLIGGNNKGTISNTYATSQDGVQFIYGVDNAAHTTDAASAKGADALMKMPELFKYRNEKGNYESYWAIVPGGTPILASFAKLTDTECKAIDLSWYSEDADVYTLMDASDLYGFALLTYGNDANSFEGKTIRLGADIIINEGDANTWNQNKAPAYQWITMGANNVTDASDTAMKRAMFNGTFDGKDPKTGEIYSISGLYLNGGGDQRRGFFSEVGASAVLKNFRLVNSYLYSRHHNLGSIAGRAYGGTFENIYSDATVASGGNDYIGGLVGTVMDGNKITMSNCWFAGTVSGASNGEYIGGLIAYANGNAVVDMSNCLNSGTVISTSTSATPVVGGLIGAIDKGGATIKNSLSTADVSINTPATGGYGLLVGTATGTTEINSTYATNCETCKVLAPGSVTLTSSQAVNKTEIYGADALTKMPNLFLYKNANGEYESYWAIVPNGTPVLASLADANTEKSLLIDTSWFGNKTEYTLKDASALYGFALLSKQAENQGFANITIKLGGNIEIPNTGEAKDWKTTAPEYAWIGIGNGTAVQFSGTFNGQGNRISGIYVNTSAERKGLFECLSKDARLENFALLNSYFYGTKNHLASVAGSSYGGALDTIYSDAIVECGDNANIISGMVGRVQTNEITINNCWFGGSVTNTGTGTGIGGFIGKADAKTTIANCLNSGTITANGTTTPFVGGFIGNSTGTNNIYIQNSLNTGKIVTAQGAGDCGLIIGKCANYAANKAKFSNTYTVEQAGMSYVCDGTGAIAEADRTVPGAEILGAAAESKLSALFATGNWVTVDGSYPVLKSFETYAVAEYAASLKEGIKYDRAGFRSA